jgi:membrane glycosyltransferase
MKTNWSQVWNRAGWTLLEGVIGGLVAATAYLTSVVTDPAGVVALTVLSAALAAVAKNYFTEREEI